jgi:hypothetical protein
MSKFSEMQESVEAMVRRSDDLDHRAVQLAEKFLADARQFFGATGQQIAPCISKDDPDHRVGAVDEVVKALRYSSSDRLYHFHVRFAFQAGRGYLVRVFEIAFDPDHQGQTYQIDGEVRTDTQNAAWHACEYMFEQIQEENKIGHARDDDTKRRFFVKK